MTPPRLFFVFILIFVSFHTSDATGLITLSGVLDIIHVAKDITIALVKAWDLVDQNIDFSEVPIPILHKTENKLFGRIERINSKLEDLAARVDTIGTQSMTTILHNLPERIRLELRLNDLLDYITRMDTNYLRMQKYSTEQKDYERLTLEDFSETVISHDPSSVINLVERIHAFVVPHRKGITNGGLFELLANAMQQWVCEAARDQPR